MGLMDILNGMQNGPGGRSQPAPSGSSSGGMSPMMMALLGLLAYKAMKGGMFGGSANPTQPAPSPGSSGGLGDVLGGLLGGGRPGAAPGSGGLNDVLGGLLGGSSNRSAGAPGGGLGDLLGGLLGGGAAGSALNSGLGNLLNDLQKTGQGRVAQSWVGPGQNEPIQPQDLSRALGADTIDALSARTGLAQDDLLAGLSQYLPQMVDQLTPDGRLPTDEEAATRW